MEKALKSAFGGSVDDCLDVSGKGLTCVYFKEVLAFFRSINLSNNHLKYVKSLVPYLLQCNELKLDGNHISDQGNLLRGIVNWSGAAQSVAQKTNVLSFYPPKSCFRILIST